MVTRSTLLFINLCQKCFQLCISSRIFEVTFHIVGFVDTIIPDCLVEAPCIILFDLFTEFVTIPLVIHIDTVDTYHSHLGGEHPLFGEVVECRNQFTLCQVTACTENNDNGRWCCR
jgi:hypothetical protein